MAYGGAIKKCPYCNGQLDYYISAAKDDHVIKLYKCRICGKTVPQYFYRYVPSNCPKHNWVFEYREFHDTPDSHTIDLVFICDRCGAVRKEPQDMKRSGITGRVELDDPRVTPTLALNKSVIGQMSKDLKKFWKDTDDEPVI